MKSDMVDFSICNAATGQIVSTGTCPRDHLELQPLPAGTIIVPEGANWDEKYLDVDTLQMVEKPPRPDPQHQFNYATKQWADPRSLRQVKDAQWASVKLDRDAAEFGVFTWDGSTFDANSISQSRIQGAAQLATLAISAGEPYSTNWTLADNTVRPLSAADMIAVGMAMGAHIGTQHERGRALRAQIEAATTPAEVQAVSW